MDLERNKQVIRGFFEAGNRGDIGQCMALLDDGVTWTTMGSTRYSGSFKGKETLLSQVVEPLFGQLKRGIHSTIDNLVAEGDFVVAQTRGQAETQGGKSYDNRYCHIFRIRDGSIVEVTEYLDTELVSRVFGGK
jgi:uncharacterized protein